MRNPFGSVSYENAVNEKGERVYSASERVKAGLAAVTARGTKLGVPKVTKVKGSQIGRVLGAAANAAKADAFAKQMRSIFDELAGLSASAAACELERRGYATARGGKWSARHVIRIRRRLEAAS